MLGLMLNGRLINPCYITALRTLKLDNLFISNKYIWLNMYKSPSVGKTLTIDYVTHVFGFQAESCTFALQTCILFQTFQCLHNAD